MQPTHLRLYSGDSGGRGGASQVLQGTQITNFFLAEIAWGRRCYLEGNKREKPPCPSMDLTWMKRVYLQTLWMMEHKDAKDATTGQKKKNNPPAIKRQIKKSDACCCPRKRYSARRQRQEQSSDQKGLDVLLHPSLHTSKHNDTANRTRVPQNKPCLVHC